MPGTTLRAVLAGLVVLALKMVFETKTSDIWPIPHHVKADILDNTIVSKCFTVLPSGRAMVCEITLKNNFVVHGISVIADKNSFDTETAKTISYAKARQKIWELEAYTAYNQLYKESN